MSANVSGPIAQAVIDLINDLEVTFTAGGSNYTETIAGYRWSQNGYDRLPAGAVLLPAIDRRPADGGGETQIGARDYLIEFPVEFLFDIDRTDYAQELALATVEAWIDAVDASDALNGTVDDVVVTTVGPPVIDTAANRPLIVYPTTLEVLQLAA